MVTFWTRDDDHVLYSCCPGRFVVYRTARLERVSMSKIANGASIEDVDTFSMNESVPCNTAQTCPNPKAMIVDSMCVVYPSKNN